MREIKVSSTRSKKLLPLSREDLERIPASANSVESLAKATGGRIERIGRIKIENALILNMNGRRLVYVRPQSLQGERTTGYGTSHLRKKLDPNGEFDKCHFDHVASTGVDGKRMGMSYVLTAFVNRDVNQLHGRTVEKGPVPTREAAKAFQGGIDRNGKHHVSYLTQEMVDKLSGKAPSSSGHGTFSSDPSAMEMKKISSSLMLDRIPQNRLAKLGANPKLASRYVPTARKRPPTGRSC